MDQYYGLNAWARDLLSKTVEVEEKGERIFPNGIMEPFSRIIFVSDHKTTFYSALDGSDEVGTYNLHRYVFEDGSWIYEYVQAVSMYSGPCYFIALKTSSDEIMEESLWTKEEMRSANF